MSAEHTAENDAARHYPDPRVTPPDEPVEMHHCDGCGEDYNAFEESHAGHVIPPALTPGAEGEQ